MLDCAAHFKEELKETPPVVDSRENFAVWMCGMHNNVNKILGKPIFDCSFENLSKRWYKGGEKCDNPGF